MEQVLLISLAIKVAFAVGGVVMARWMLRQFDRALGITDFAETIMAQMINDGRSCALYFGLRFVGVCMLIGLVIS